MISTVLKISICLFSLWLVKKIQISYFSPLSSVPNAHATAPFSRLWLLVMKYRGRENRARFDAHKRLGRVVRIGPRELSVDCIEDGVKLVYGGEFEKDEWYARAFRGEGKPYMFTTLSKRNHAERKRMLASLYSQSYIQSSPELEEISKVIVLGSMRTRVDAWAREHATVNVLEKNKACLMDLTTAWLYGLGNGTDLMTDGTAADQVLGAFKLGSAGFFWRSEFSGMIKLIEWFGLHLVPQAAYHSRQLIGEWNSAMCKMASKRLLDRPSTNDEVNLMTSYPLVYAQLRRRLEESDLPSEELEATLSRELLDHLVASHDASGITLTYLMHKLSQRKALQRVLREELCRSRASNPTTFTQRQVHNLPLLDAVLMETLRLHSANPGPWPRRVPVTSCRLGPFSNIPAGTVVSASSYSLHRNGEIFPQPEEWRPERWMHASAKKHSEMMRWFWAFGSGARMCIGRYFAIQSMKSIVATIYADFETSLVDDSEMEQVDGVLAPPVADRLLLKFRYVGTKPLG